MNPLAKHDPPPIRNGRYMRISICKGCGFHTAWPIGILSPCARCGNDESGETAVARWQRNAPPFVFWDTSGEWILRDGPGQSGAEESASPEALFEGAMEIFTKRVPAQSPEKKQAMTKDEFVQQYAKNSGITVEELAELDRVAAPCSCGDKECGGWRMLSLRDFIEEGRG